MNGLNFIIRDELTLHEVRIVEEVYQLALAVEEKLARSSWRRLIMRGARTLIQRWREGRIWNWESSVHSGERLDGSRKDFPLRGRGENATH